MARFDNTTWEPKTKLWLVYLYSINIICSKKLHKKFTEDNLFFHGATLSMSKRGTRINTKTLEYYMTCYRDSDCDLCYFDNVGRWNVMACLLLAGIC